ncbi:phosphomethylpyrimidine kinase [Methanogenium marinum]|uniref:Phosphomethylpyrimidine kinase n=1 Tax=Methanogenium marinum TaxID=348610 RepID=A0A9Q4KRK1_9EURY|nr:thiamine-phosphate synthase family protein [Methanogenium marinum]MDE4907259.1 phosphomethylpyrimidine kinase [Methanogenium marinum]
MQTREDVAQALQEAAAIIAAEADPRLVPEGGIRMGYALHGATTPNDVCAVDNTSAHVRFGTDAGVARLLLTIIRHEGCLRSAAAVRCTTEILRCITDDLALDGAPYPDAPPGTGTMDWGVESCCRDGVPDAIYGQKTDKKDLILWIIAENPANIARNIIMLSGCISYTSL